MIKSFSRLVYYLLSYNKDLFLSSVELVLFIWYTIILNCYVKDLCISIMIIVGTSYNAALNQPTSESSESDHDGYRAVDGCWNSYIQAGCCFHSYSEINPWFTIDLGEQLYFRSVTLFYRGDCPICSKYLYSNCF